MHACGIVGDRACPLLLLVPDVTVASMTNGNMKNQTFEHFDQTLPYSYGFTNVRRIAYIVFVSSLTRLPFLHQVKY